MKHARLPWRVKLTGMLGALVALAMVGACFKMASDCCQATDLRTRILTDGSTTTAGQTCFAGKARVCTAAGHGADAPNP